MPETKGPGREAAGASEPAPPQPLHSRHPYDVEGTEYLPDTCPHASPAYFCKDCALVGVKRLVEGLAAAEARELEHDRNNEAVAETLRTLEARAVQAERENREVCICAAVRLQDGRIIRGHRHDDCILTAIKLKVVDYVTQDSQGFVTSRNRFVGRKEGAALQRLAGIKSAMTGLDIGILFSEDLYFDDFDRQRHDALTIKSTGALPDPHKEPKP